MGGVLSAWLASPLTSLFGTGLLIVGAFFHARAVRTRRARVATDLA